MSYAAYFNWSEVPDARLWHPIDLPELTEDEAKSVARMLKQIFPHKRFAYGPRFQDGIQEVSR